jgi:LacI family transcriptional regulator
MATLNDVAKHAGVSRSTVSLVLRASPLVADATRSRVEASMRACGYVYNRSAANLRAARTYTIGLVVSDVTNPFYAELVAGVEAVLEAAGNVVFITNTEESGERQQRFLRRMLEQRVDGVLISAAGGTKPSAFDAFADARIPVVQMLRAVDTQRFDYVTGDNRLGTSLAAEHLIRSGHRRIGYLGTRVGSTVTAERLEGFRETLVRYGLAPDPRTIRSCLPNWQEAKSATAEILAAPRVPTALLCFNDFIALGAMLAIAESGRVPGRDLAVVGFDDIELASAWRPSLTTVAVRAREMGNEAGRLLLQRIASPSRPPDHVIFAPRLVVRESSGVPLIMEPA